MTLTWQDPLEIASLVKPEEENWILLYSGLSNDFTGDKSFLALKTREVIIGENFDKLEQIKDRNDYYFGYLAYDLKNSVEDLPIEDGVYIKVPNLYLVNYAIIFVFYHHERKIEVFIKDDSDKDYYIFEQLDLASLKAEGVVPQGIHGIDKKMDHQVVSDHRDDGDEAKLDFKITSFASNMDNEQYYKKVKKICELIREGVIYQANLTRKFFGTIETKNNYFDFFCKLTKLSPAAYSAFVKHRDQCFLSYSPEQFLTITPEGMVSTRPIKGTAMRGVDAEQDERIKKELQNCPKNLSENLMITDLMRNDLSRTCFGVKTPRLFELTSYANLHHLSSTVEAMKMADKTVFDVIKSSFPPGSITGAPKIQAIKICSYLEKYKRGVYSGNIGWINPAIGADLSVAIRTITFELGRFEFQVGGGIVIDSTPKDELKEIATKMKAASDLLGISMEDLEKIGK